MIGVISSTNTRTHTDNRTLTQTPWYLNSIRLQNFMKGSKSLVPKDYISFIRNKIQRL